MSVEEILERDATGQAAAVAAGDVRPVELVEAAIARMEASNPRVRAVIFDRFERALGEARRPGTGPFAGVPMLVKDALALVEGLPHTAGTRLLRDAGHVADHDSWLVARYRAAGFIICGSTNLPELALRPVTDSEAYGAVPNPWDPDRNAGGSSGGSAAAVAHRWVAVAHGNDMGGSIRVPASFCGLIGLKPSRARTTLGPDFGEYWGQMTHEHVLCRSVRDAAAVLDATAGYGPGDPYVAPPPTEPWIRSVSRDPPRLTVGLLSRPPGGGPVDPAVADAVLSVGRALEAAGHIVVEDAPVALDDPSLVTSYLTVFCTHVASELERLGRIVGRPVRPDDVEDRTWALADQGRSVTSVELVAATADLHRWTRRVAAWFEGPERHADLLITPTTPGPAIAPGDEELSAVTFTLPFNVSGQPAVSVPVPGHRPPVGVQLVGPYGREDLVLGVAAQLERTGVIGVERPPPPPEG